MLLYDFKLAPGPRRVRFFAAEKGLELPSVQVNLRAREQFAPEFRAKNPACTVPVLELAEGQYIWGVDAICRYLEELHPTPPLLGTDALDRARVTMWNERVMQEGYAAAGETVRNSSPLFRDRGLSGTAGGFAQIPALVERGRKRLERFAEMLDERLGESPHVAGDGFSMADIAAVVALDFARRAEFQPPERLSRLQRWYRKVCARPAAAA